MRGPRRARSSLGSPRRRARGARDGFTLVEAIVVLVLLGLAFAIVAPSLRFPAPAPVSAERAMIASAKSAALRRASPVLLDLRADGHWRVSADAGDDTTTLASGVLAPARAALRVHVTALGACLPDSDAPRRGDWDAIACAERAR